MLSQQFLLLIVMHGCITKMEVNVVRAVESGWICVINAEMDVKGFSSTFSVFLFSQARARARVRMIQIHNFKGVELF